MSCTWLTIKEVAEYLRVHHFTIRKWIKSGQLRAYHPMAQARLYRVCLEDLEKFMEVNHIGRKGTR